LEAPLKFYEIDFEIFLPLERAANLAGVKIRKFDNTSQYDSAWGTEQDFDQEMEWVDWGIGGEFQMADELLRPRIFEWVD